MLKIDGNNEISILGNNLPKVILLLWAVGKQNFDDIPLRLLRIETPMKMEKFQFYIIK